MENSRLSKSMTGVAKYSNKDKNKIIFGAKESCEYLWPSKLPVQDSEILKQRWI